MVERADRIRIAIIQRTASFVKKVGVEAQTFDGNIPLKKQIAKLIKGQQVRQGDKPEYLLFSTTQEKFIEAAEDVLRRASNNEAENYFKSLSLIIPDSKESSDKIDPTTGIRIRNIRKGEIRFATHPTPDS